MYVPHEVAEEAALKPAVLAHSDSIWLAAVAAVVLTWTLETWERLTTAVVEMLAGFVG